jgi:threonine dehydrogenase-like Zn-dependent dehydrogenase
MKEVFTRALVLDGAMAFDPAAPVPVAPPGEALVRVLLAGICGTDIELLKGYWGFRGIPGHEFVGEVVAAGREQLVGCVVVGEINCSCGTCVVCRSGRPRHCPTRTVLGIDRRDGAFAEFLRLPEDNLHVVPPGLPPERAVFTEPLAACYRILEQVDVGPSTRVVVLGDGRLGLLAAQVLHTTGAHVTVVGRTESKLTVARSLKLRTDTAESAAARFRGLVDVVVDATGSPSGLAAALELVRAEGTIVMKTTVAGAVPLEGGAFVVNEVKLVGSRCGSFEPALAALAAGAIQVDKLISAVYPLAQWSQAFEAAQSAGGLKVLLRPGS